MSVGQVIVTLSLLSRMYGVPEPLMQCLVYAESSYDVNATNGIHEGLCQYNPDTRLWLAEKAVEVGADTSERWTLLANARRGRG